MINAGVHFLKNLSNSLYSFSHPKKIQSPYLPNPINISSQFVGAPYKVSDLPRKRIIYALSLNETSSISDRIHPFNDVEIKSKRKAALQINIPSTWLNKKVSSKEIALVYKDMIEEHIERRVMIFFNQLVTTYNTQLQFEIGKTLHQGGSGKRLFIKSKKGKIISFGIQRQSAHSSTIPCLIAYDRDEWIKSLINQSVKPQGHIYLKDSDYYRSAQSTLEMPGFINHADLCMDGDDHGKMRLRSKSIAILNESSMALVDPEEGLIKFFDAVIEVIDSLNQEKLGEDIKEVLRIYRQTILEIKAKMNESYGFIDRLLHLNHDTKNIEPEALKLFRLLRYRSIFNEQQNQSRIIQEIDRISNLFFSSLQSSFKILNINVQLPLYHAAFKSLFISRMRESIEKRRLSSWLCNGGENLFANAHDQGERWRHTIVENTKDQLNSFTDNEIDHYVQMVQEDLSMLKLNEELQAGKILKLVREVKNINKTEILKEIKTNFPNQKITLAKLNQIEEGLIPLDAETRKIFSKIYAMDETLLLPIFGSV